MKDSIWSGFLQTERWDGTGLNGGQSNPHKWLASRKIWSVEELETLPAGTKPRASHHRPPGGDRRAKTWLCLLCILGHCWLKGFGCVCYWLQSWWHMSSEDNSVVRAPDSWSKRSRVRVPAEAAGDFSFPGLTFCADFYFGIRFSPVLPQLHVKYPGHSAKSAGGRLQLNTHSPNIRLCCFAWSDVTWCMVVWCTRNAPRWQQFHVAPAM